MSKGRWIIAVAFGLIATLGAAQDQPAPENQPSQNETPADGQDESGADQAQPVDITPALESIESALRDLKAEVDEVEQNRQRNASQRDLDAQEGMAWWAELMFYTAIVSVLLTAIALWAIIQTLRHTRRAAEASEGMLKEARATTKAAEQGAAVTREMGQAQTRAYVSITNISAEIRKTGSVAITLNLKNTGLSPAQDVEITYRTYLAAVGSNIQAPSEGLPFGPFRSGAQKTTPFDIASGTTRSREFGIGNLDDALIENMTNHKSMIQVEVTVEFRDVFGNVEVNRDTTVYWNWTDENIAWENSVTLERFPTDKRRQESHDQT